VMHRSKWKINRSLHYLRSKERMIGKEEEEELTVTGGVRREVGILSLASAVVRILHRKEDEKKRGK
jgi:hypothetical protein